MYNCKGLACLCRCPCSVAVWKGFNIACYYHLVWHSSTTTFYPPFGSRCQHVNMHGRTGQKLHSKSKIIRFLFLYIIAKNPDIKRKSLAEHDNIKTINIDITRDRSLHHRSWKCVKHWSGGKKVGFRRQSRRFSHVVRQGYLCTLEERGSSCQYGGAVQWRFTHPGWGFSAVQSSWQISGKMRGEDNKKKGWLIK